MSKTRWWMMAALAAALAAGCGGGDDDDDDVTGPDAAGTPDAPAGGPDAAPDVDAPAGLDASGLDAGEPTACGEFETPDGTISSYPGTFDGDITAGTALIEVASGDCAVEQAPFGVAVPGFEQVIRLEGLAAGTEYGVKVDAAFDSAVYVATSCTGANGPIAGECLAFADTAADPEITSFTQPSFIAPEDGVAFVVVDNFNPTAPATGTFTLSVTEAECVNHFGCTTTGAPVCDDFACVAGPGACVGDDGEPPENADDGPVGATTLALDTPLSANVCNETALESDFYVITAGAGDNLQLDLTWADAAADLDFYVYDAAGALVAQAFTTANPEVVVLGGLDAGDYYVQVDKYEDSGSPPTSTAVTPYTLTASTPECVWDADCTTSGLPVCDDSVCVTGYDDCTDDDSAENDDDGAGLGTPVTVPTDGSTATFDRAICSLPSIDGSAGTSLERDWYVLTVADGTLSVSLDWPGTEDLDVGLFDPDGALVASAASDVKPETFTEAVTAGTYYLVVVPYSPVDVAAAASYSLELSQTP